jgi:hypothetical protein
MRQFIFILVGVMAGLLSSAEADSLTVSEKADGYGTALGINVSHKRHHHYRYSLRRHHGPHPWCASRYSPCYLSCPCCPSGCYHWDTDASPLDNVLALGIGGSFLDGGIY